MQSMSLSRVSIRNFELDSQTFLEKGNKKYDILTVKLPGGTKKDIWFDITDFYGREDD